MAISKTLADKQYFKSKIFTIKSPQDFEELALELFRFQAKANVVYARYLNLLGIEIEKVDHVGQIPFLPIRFFKEFEVITGNFSPELTFKSSATGGHGQSIHHLSSIDTYKKGSELTFEQFYGKPEEYCVLALLPSYLERGDSSLVEMCQRFIMRSMDKDSGFYLDNLKALSHVLKQKQAAHKPCLLIGVSFALLDLAEQYPMNLESLIIMETGGMKGRRKEMIRTELHAHLQAAFNVSKVHSEYGMTELLSQAYSKGAGVFETPPWMQVLIRQTDDPFGMAAIGKTGGVNVIDLTNIDSCAFIETMDLGRMRANKTFEILGRFDHAEVRGCNLMVQ